MNIHFHKIGLVNHMGGGNLGDDATQTAVIQNIRTRWPNTEIVAFSMNPPDTQSRHGITSYPLRTETWVGRTADPSAPQSAPAKSTRLFGLLRAINRLVPRFLRIVIGELRFLAASYGRLRSLDVLIISGGGQLLDSWGGSWKFPYTIFKWVVLAKLSHVKCYFLNVGAGPLRCALSKWFVKRALFLADYSSFRDEQSRKLVQQIGFNGVTHVRPDNVYSLNTARLHGDPKQGTGVNVGIAPMGYCDPRRYWDKNQAVYDRLVQQLALFGSCLVQNDHRLTLFATDIVFDAQTLEDVHTALNNYKVDSAYIQHEPINGTEDLFRQMSSMDYIVTCRFHGVVFAHLMNIPVIALSHHHKVATLMSDLGLSEYCLDIHKCDSALLTSTFASLTNNRDDIKRRMAASAATFKKELSTQFDGLFPQEPYPALWEAASASRGVS
jgi:polysaccharide pyruvyl transferase WcaK-like protein